MDAQKLIWSDVTETPKDVIWFHQDDDVRVYPTSVQVKLIMIMVYEGGTFPVDD